jgi:hypothetical protein
MGAYSQRSALPCYGDRREVDTFQFNPIAKAVFNFASATFEVRAYHDWRVKSRNNARPVQLLQEKNKYDQIPLGIYDRLQRILPLAEKVADEIVCDETDILEEIIPRMLKVMRRVAEYSCDYVRRGRLGRQASS